MTPSDTDLDLLARTLATRLPTWEDRAAVASGAGLADVQLSGGSAQGSWRLLLGEAVDQGRLPALLRVAARRAGDDAALARLAEGAQTGRLDLAGGRARREGGGLVWVAVGVGVIALLLAAWYGSKDESVPGAPNSDAAADQAGDEAASPPPEPPSRQAPLTAPPPEAEPVGEAVAEPVDEAVAEPVDEAVAAGGPAAIATPPAGEAPPHAEPPPPVAASRGEPVAPPPAASAPPTAPSGACEGWAYMGATTELRAGQTWIVEGGVNVRADLPRPENRYDARARLICSLPHGARVTLSEDPTYVRGGAYWVRVQADDVAR